VFSFIVLQGGKRIIVKPMTDNPETRSLLLTERKLRLLLPACICLIFFAWLWQAARQHPYGTYATETDFYQLYAPDAERLLHGNFPENTYQGPFYSLVLAAVMKFTGDAFVAGKWLSVVSAVLAVFFVFLLFEKLFGYFIGLGAQGLLCVGIQFPTFSINAATDVFFLTLCLATLLVYLDKAISLRWRIIINAALSSLVYLTRYNGLFLFITLALGILALNSFNLNWRERLKEFAIFTGIFLLVASPWFYANYKHHGSPFYSTSYLNIATEFYPDLAQGSVMQEGTRALSEKFHSLGEVLRYDPKAVLSHYPDNLFDHMKRSVITTKNDNLISDWVGWLAVIGILFALIERRSKAVFLILISALVYFLVVALTHWEARYYFYIMALYAGFAAYAIVRPFEWLQKRGWLKSQAWVALPIVLLAFVWYQAFTASKKSLDTFLASHPKEVFAAGEYLKNSGASYPRIVARKPHLAFWTRGEWLYFPTVKSLDELRDWLRNNDADYVAFGARELQSRPGLEALKDTTQAPAWLKPVWTNDTPLFNLYEVRRDAL
jgi:hypothetical protein